MSAHVLWDGKGAIVDLVFVHGLNGHHMDTWSKGKVCWPQQLLNKDIPQSRIITWGYEADLVNFVGSASHASIFMHADNLLTDIGNLRRGCNNRPLIFLCHSLGGLVVKEALINANISFHNEDNPRRASIFENTKGIIFFGTPHRGSPTMSHADLVSKTAKVVLHKSNERLIHALREESQLLDIQRTRFSAVGKDVKIVCFSEEREMSVGMIVPLHSAVIDGHGVLVSSIPENHSNMCKFKEGAVGYVRTKEYLLDMIESFGAASSQYVLEKLVTDMFRKRRNPNFTGRESELADIHRVLSQDDQSFPSRVVVCGLGGVGKTQIVLEYCHRLRESQPDLPVFWFTATGSNDLKHQYGLLANDVSWHLRNSNLGRFNREFRERYNRHGSKDRLVTEWMSTLPFWVLVMDNFDNPSFDIEPFIPSGGMGKVLFTTRSRERLHEESAPSRIDLTHPNEGDAALLFLRLRSHAELSYANFQQHPEYAEAKKIVRSLHYFPLALSQAAAYIRESDPFTCGQYLELLSEHEDREYLLRYRLPESEYPESLMTTWEISLKYLLERSPEAGDLLQLLGFFAPAEIPPKMLRGAVLSRKWRYGSYTGERRLDQEQLRQLRCLSVHAALISRINLLDALLFIRKDNPDEYIFTKWSTISVHPLVHEWIKVRLKPDQEEAYRLANLCALVLYQTYSLDHYQGILDSDTYEGKLIVNQAVVDRQLMEVLRNVKDYEHNSSSPAIELRTLLLSVFLDQTSAFSRKGGVERYLDYVCYTFAKLSPQQADYLGSFQANIFKGCLIRPLEWRGIFRALDSSLKEPHRLSWSPAQLTYVFLFTCTVFSILQWQLPSQGSRPGTAKSRMEKLSADDQIAILRKLLLFLYKQGPTPPGEISYLRSMVKFRIAKEISYKDYWRMPHQFLADSIDEQSFQHFPLPTLACYFTHLLKLHNGSHNDVGAISAAVQLFDARYRSWVSTQDLNEDKRAMYESAFISTSGGRHDRMFQPVMHDNRQDISNLVIIFSNTIFDQAQKVLDDCSWIFEQHQHQVLQSGTNSDPAAIASACYTLVELFDTLAHLDKLWYTATTIDTRWVGRDRLLDQHQAILEGITARCQQTTTLGSRSSNSFPQTYFGDFQAAGLLVHLDMAEPHQHHERIWAKHTRKDEESCAVPQQLTNITNDANTLSKLLAWTNSLELQTLADQKIRQEWPFREWRGTCAKLQAQIQQKQSKPRHKSPPNPVQSNLANPNSADPISIPASISLLDLIWSLAKATMAISAALPQNELELGLDPVPDSHFVTSNRTKTKTNTKAKGKTKAKAKAGNANEMMFSMDSE